MGIQKRVEEFDGAGKSVSVTLEWDLFEIELRTEDGRTCLTFHSRYGSDLRVRSSAEVQAVSGLIREAEERWAREEAMASEKPATPPPLAWDRIGPAGEGELEGA